MTLRRPTWAQIQRAAQRDYAAAGRASRAIVAKRVPALGGLGIILGELTRDRLLTVGLSTAVTHWATVAFSVLGVVAGVLWAQRGTTPADPALQPRDKYGNDLVSALDAGPHAGLGAGADTFEVPSAEAALARAAAINQSPASDVAGETAEVRYPAEPDLNGSTAVPAAPTIPALSEETAGGTP